VPNYFPTVDICPKIYYDKNINLIPRDERLRKWEFTFLVFFIAADKQGCFFGKPYPEMVEALCDKFGIDRNKVAMVGDRLYTDIALGQRAGITSILVLSSETQPEDLPGSPSVPDIIAADLGELTKWLR
jgi:ribonucleotide monophosphatase NagD (HAD superfamily)